MRSRFNGNFATLVRSATFVGLIAVAGLMFTLPIGCGSVDDTTTTTPSPTPSNNTLDGIPMEDIVWDGNMSPLNFTAIGPLKGIEIQNGNSYAPTICWSWDQPNWPMKDGKSMGNNWIIVKINGVWHATPWEHLPGGNKVCRTTEARRGQPPFIQGYGPIAGWHPTSGEPVGFMNTTICRGAQGGYNNLKQRTYILMTKWP
jgi:hypothetical protein